MPQKISAPPKTKTTIRLNMAMTIDGHVAHPTQAWEFGSAEDRRRMDRLREWADCLIVARRTIEHDDMNLTVRTKPHSRKHPRPVIVMQTTRPIKTGLRTLANKAIGGELWISQATPNTTLQEVWPELNEDWPIYSFSRVTEIVASLKERGFNKILLEGGPTLNGFFFEAALVDEFFLTILPILWGGTTTDRTVITPNPLPITHFRLQSAERRKNEIFFHYKKRTSSTPAA